MLTEQLPTLWFAVLMAGHVLDHLFFSATRLSPTVRLASFAIWTFAVVASFWWFKDLALGIDGPVNDHNGWLWRPSWNVSTMLALPGPDTDDNRSTPELNSRSSRAERGLANSIPRINGMTPRKMHQCNELCHGVM